MPARRVSAWLAVAVLLSACTGRPMAPAPVLPAEDTALQQSGPTVSPVPPAQSSPPAQSAPPRTLPEVLVQPARGALERIIFQAGDVVSAHGMYFLNAETGTGEGWIYPGNRYYWGTYVSENNRFFALYAGEDGYLVDRRTGTVSRWDPAQVRLLLADMSGFMFAEVAPRNGNAAETGRYVWTGPDFQPRHVFTLGADGTRGPSPLLSPDRKRLALFRRGAGDRHHLALFDLDSGSMLKVDTPTADHVSAAYLRRYGEGFQVELTVMENDPLRERLRRQNIVRRFSWTGESLRDLSIPGAHVLFSPDGKWVAWEEWPAGNLVPATTIADSAILQPHLQALGTTPCFQVMAGGGTRWLADSSGLVVDTSAGYRLLTIGGELEERAAFAGLNWKDEPQPAPDHPDRFAIGRLAIVDGTGSQRLGVILEGHVTPTSLPPWGDSGAELRFALPPPGRGGACSEGARPSIPTKVLLPAQSLPEFPLMVRSGGRCLQLRDRPHTSANELACLPDGTLLAEKQLRSDSPTIQWSDSWWLSVKTREGEIGWVSLAGEQVIWAEDASAQELAVLGGLETAHFYCLRCGIDRRLSYTTASDHAELQRIVTALHAMEWLEDPGLTALPISTMGWRKTLTLQYAEGSQKTVELAYRCSPPGSVQCEGEHGVVIGNGRSARSAELARYITNGSAAEGPGR